MKQIRRIEQIIFDTQVRLNRKLSSNVPYKHVKELKTSVFFVFFLNFKILINSLL